MDPRLQLAILNRRTGKISMPTSSVGSDEIAVVARVKSADAWRAYPMSIQAATWAWPRRLSARNREDPRG